MLDYWRMKESLSRWLRSETEEAEATAFLLPLRDTWEQTATLIVLFATGGLARKLNDLQIVAGAQIVKKVIGATFLNQKEAAHRLFAFESPNEPRQSRLLTMPVALHYAHHSCPEYRWCLKDLATAMERQQAYQSPFAVKVSDQSAQWAKEMQKEGNQGDEGPRAQQQQMA